ncbi:hypothetical protein QBC38DRAFT_474692 [Podospora fimiseda]|uniref:Steroid 5-alpha reductase C-terminal domain-containing protein n=1 Tax=Podospora fimiseda TaxID=252190 RepID=A0AAN7GWM1_9PEZI|nr:hypothetical protein QBC38DRAFT_474692 [Podospora fimiseda]
MCPKNTSPKKGVDLIARGQYGVNPLGTATFIGLRALDPILQYHLIHPTKGLLASLFSKFSISTIPVSSLPTVSFLSLSLPLPHWIIISLSSIAALKQIFWLLYTNKEVVTPSTAVAVGTFNSVVNSINSAFFIASATSAVYATPQITIPVLNEQVSLPVALGALSFFVGIAMETVPEIQRKFFKEDPTNRFRICDVGLWGWARHINYGAYAIWRAGYGLAAGGWGAGIFMGAWQVGHFVTHSMGLMDDYMAGKYGAKWEAHKRKVKYLLVPGIY